MRMISAGEAIKIVQKFFPEADDKKAYEMLWGNTGWPGFWHRSPQRDIRNSMRRLKKTIASGRIPCEFCSRPCKKYPKYTCRHCTKALNSCKED